MINLIKKDLLIYRKAIIPTIVFLLLFETILFWFDPDGFINNCTFVALLSPMFMVAYDLKKNNLMMLCSLPVKRAGIVISKFIIVFLFVVVCVASFVLLGLAMINFFGASENIVNEIKSGYESLIAFPLFLMSPLSLLYYIVFKTKLSNDTWAFMGKYYLAWLIGAIPVAAVFIFVAFLIFGDLDIDFTPVAMEIGLPRLLLLNLFLLTICLSVSAWFSIRVFKKKDI